MMRHPLCHGALLALGALLATPGLAQVREAVEVAPSRLDGDAALLSVDRLADDARLQVRQAPPAPAFDAGMLPARPYVVELHLDRSRLDAPAEGLRYDFGDGQMGRATTVAQHDYRPAMDHGRRSTTFTVRLLDRAGVTLSTRPITLVSDIAISREMGFAQGELTTPDPDDDLACPFQQPVVLTNHEGEAVVYTRFLRSLHPCDPTGPPIVQDVDLYTGFGRPEAGDGVSVRPPIEPGRLVDGRAVRPSPGLLYLDPGASARGLLELPCEQTVDVCVVSWTLVGRTRSGRRAYADTHAEIARNPLMLEELDRFTVAFLDALVAEGLVPDPHHIDFATLRRLEAEGHINRTADGWEVVK